MGALTSNRKRAEEISSFNKPNLYSHSPEFHAQKRPRFSFPSLNEGLERLNIASSKTTVSRLARYPEAQSQLRREVHAPCRIVKFGSWKHKSKSFGDRGGYIDAMGNTLGRQYVKARNIALDSLRYLGKGKEVIVVDDEPDKKTETVNVEEPDLSVEEIVNVEDDGREGQSAVSEERRFGEGSGLVVNAKVLATSGVSNLTDDSVRVDSAGKMLDSLSLGRTVESLDAYKKLLEDAARRDSKLNDLKFQIEFNEKKRSYFSVSPTKQQKEEVPVEPFIPLTNEDEEFIKRAFSSNRRKILVTHDNSNIEITGEILQCLRPGAWLNDEVINVYLELLKERETREPKKFLKCHFFNTFFYKKLTGGRGGYDYKSVRRWTTQRKLGYGLIECDKIFVPIHQEIHWCLGVINKKDKKFQYLDSLRGRDTRVMNVLSKYFVDEVKDKSGKDVDVSSWEHEYVEDLPAQENGYDCGMFMIKYADFYSRGLDLCFDQEHMTYFRRRTAKEILKLRAD